MAGAGADPALSGAGPRPSLCSGLCASLQCHLGRVLSASPQLPHPEALPLEPWRAAEVLRRRFPAPPPQAGTAPRELPERSAPPPQHPCPGGGDRDMQGHRGAADSAAPGCAPPPAPAGQRAQACWQRCHTGPLAGLLWLLVCGPHCAWGWQLMLGAGLVQAPARCPKGAQGVGRKRVRPLRRDAGPASRPPRLHAVSREPRLGQSSSVPGHLAWSPATRTWGADTPKG